jgi:hypothetical protein
MADYPTEQFGFFTADVKTPDALRVCRESREVALREYVAWPIFKVIQSMSSFYPRIDYKEMMWNPKVDVVDFLSADGTTLEMNRLLPMFAKQFPLQAKRVQRLALPSSFWDSPSSQRDIGMIWPLIDCITLKEFIVVLDEDYEIKGVEIWRRIGYSNPRPWILPHDIGDHIDRLRDHCKKWVPEYNPLGEKPVVRIVKNESGLFTDEDRQLVLRCFPCPSIGVV